ncbi:MAG: hypothetical protein AAFQ12_04070 [Pseudomonadota bacterium]
MPLTLNHSRGRAISMPTSSIRPALITCVALLVAIPTASAECDISQTKCAVNGGKCNIHFKNKTGDSGGSDGSSNIEQTSAAQTVIVKARKGRRDQSATVGNKLSITAGASKTMNLDKKAEKGFHDIRIYSKDHGGTRSTVMTCEEIKAVLNGNGRCKIFHGVRVNKNPNVNFYLGYQCDGGNVGGPKDAHVD